jgi:hypothetical protein
MRVTDNGALRQQCPTINRQGSAAAPPHIPIGDAVANESPNAPFLRSPRKPQEVALDKRIKGG